MEETLVNIGRALLFALKGLQCQMNAEHMENHHYADHHVIDAFEEADRWFQKAMAEIALDELGPRDNVPTVATIKDAANA